MFLKPLEAPCEGCLQYMCCLRSGLSLVYFNPTFGCGWPHAGVAAAWTHSGRPVLRQRARHVGLSPNRRLPRAGHSPKEQQEAAAHEVRPPKSRRLRFCLSGSQQRSHTSIFFLMTTHTAVSLPISALRTHRRRDERGDPVMTTVMGRVARARARVVTTMTTTTTVTTKRKRRSD